MFSDVLTDRKEGHKRNVHGQQVDEQTSRGVSCGVCREHCVQLNER